MDHAKVGKQLVELVGGKENVVSATHCATRLRLVLHDDEKADKSAIEKLDGVKGAFASSGQYQVILGTGDVNKVYRYFADEIGAEQLESADHKEAARKNMNPVARFAKTLSNIFVPIIPAIVATGLLMGLLSLVDAFDLMGTDAGLYQMLDMFSSAAFIFLPILIGVSAAKEFGGNQYLGAVIGGIMIHPELMNPWGLDDPDAQPDVVTVLGFEVEMLGYQGTVIPILLATWIMAMIEKRLHKIVPNAVSLLVVPFVTIILTGFVALMVMGPIGNIIGEGLTVTLNFLYDYGGALAGIVFGGLYSTIVITGVHHSFHAIEANLLATEGINYLLPIWSMANVAQGGAGLAVLFLTRSKKTKEVAVPASISSFLGITEPVIFGVNLKYRRPFIAAAIGGAVGGAYVVFMNVTTVGIGITGLPMFAIVDPESIMNYVHYGIGFALAVITAFVMTYILGITDDPDEIEQGKGNEQNTEEEAKS
ncbi:PTS system sucrose-specific IIB component (Glc family) /PTS system sucrose-specific IIC component (Glc family) [Salsuginibacillus halophilus]|uniref:PTS system sucrose-specific IIB component (Glc family) /PTS system sucrose-specific IIC component (Glc family) n=1 Tax=Salsuginibacillus halophilus TaxID=517424 RepID=A0A2P8HE84_9BACI|nr:sucrose-specific PTS transporter subunit IIBC [Salsuginibacillus halophilus]PSL44530.1 PTS system sucrose-specific IIB component (Glc family) /PTS system sucrose-specific IIC component (Glc family) [Salsuginibacillus halophilus]